MEDLTNDERKRLAECMKDSEFMNLLAEYAKEISDPKHRLENEQYLRQLEQEQGAPLMKDNAVGKASKGNPSPQTIRLSPTQATSSALHSTDKNDRLDHYTTPHYQMIHRGRFDMNQHMMHQLTPVHNMPAELVIQISLPRRENASQIDLDIGTKSLSLVDEKCRYKLEIELPFQVDDESSTARFEKKNRTLTVTLSVIQPKVEPLPFIEPEMTIEEQEEEEEQNKEQQTVKHETVAPHSHFESENSSLPQVGKPVTLFDTMFINRYLQDID